MSWLVGKSVGQTFIIRLLLSEFITEAITPLPSLPPEVFQEVLADLKKIEVTSLFPKKQPTQKSDTLGNSNSSFL